VEFKLNKYHRNIPEEDLLQDMRRVAALLKQAHLSGTDYNEHGKYSYSCIQKRFRGWTNACKKAGLSYSYKLQDKIYFRHVLINCGNIGF